MYSSDRHIGESGNEDSKLFMNVKLNPGPSGPGMLCCVITVVGYKFDYTFIGFVKANMLTFDVWSRDAHGFASGATGSGYSVLSYCNGW